MLQFWLHIDIKCDQGGLTDVESLIQRAVDVLTDKPFLKFRVVGEPTLLAVFEVSDVNVMNTISSELLKRGPFSVTCTPLTPYETWARILEVDEKLTGPSPRKLTGKFILWGDVTVDYHGITVDELLSLWKDEATHVLELRDKGQIEIELFKVLGENKVHVLSCQEDPAAWEALTFKLPMIRKMGDQLSKKMKMLTIL